MQCNMQWCCSSKACSAHSPVIWLEEAALLRLLNSLHVKACCAPSITGTVTTDATLAGMSSCSHGTQSGGFAAQVLSSNLSSNTAVNGAGLALQQVTFMGMENVTIMVRPSPCWQVGLCAAFSRLQALPA